MLNKKRKTEVFLKSLKEIGLSAQVHGVSRIISNEKLPLKLMWIIFLLSSALLCIYFTFNSVKTYFSYPIITSIDSIPENPMPFPSITFCPLKPPVRDYNLSDIIIYCKFNFIVDCSKEPLFVKVYNLTEQLRPCIQFNLASYNKPILYTSRSGIYNGLIISLFEGLYDEPRFDLYGTSVSNGFQVIIQNSSDILSTDKAITIQPGVASYIMINKVITTKLSEPYNDCIKTLDTYHAFDSIFYKEIVSSGFTYSQKNCLDYGYFKTLNCSLKYGSFYEHCKPNANSLKTDVMGFFNYYLNKEFAKYIEKCPMECDSTQFDLNLFQSYYPDKEEYQSFLDNQNLIRKFPNGKNTTVDEMRKSVYNVNIYFSDLKHTLISQQAKLDIWDLVSSIGGLFGLFLGLSFLSLIDMFQIIFEFLDACCCFKPVNRINQIK